MPAFLGLVGCRNDGARFEYFSLLHRFFANVGQTKAKVHAATLAERGCKGEQVLLVSHDFGVTGGRVLLML